MTTQAIIARVCFGACPKCHGDLFYDDQDDVYACLQCARTTPPDGVWFDNPHVRVFDTVHEKHAKPHHTEVESA
ncbi:MAG TPA: hypothetical protein VI759_00400 [Dehalococcoidia bacterium]|nr:hypothetical protein [Dehalococcoidia bacterium]